MSVTFLDKFNNPIADDTEEIRLYRFAIKRAMKEEDGPVRSSSFVQDMETNPKTARCIGFLKTSVLYMRGEQLIKFMAECNVDSRIVKVEIK